MAARPSPATVMVAYIIRRARDIASMATDKNDLALLFMTVRCLPEELDRLDPRDFVPAAQLEFVYARARARQYANFSKKSIEPGVFTKMKAMAEQVASTL